MAWCLINDQGATEEDTRLKTPRTRRKQLSKSVYRLKRGLAHVTITGEPVYINSITGNIANVTRPQVDPDTGTVQYREDTLRCELLETPQGKVRRNLLLEAFAHKLVRRMEDKQWALTPKQVASIEAAAKSGKLMEVN